MIAVTTPTLPGRTVEQVFEAQFTHVVFGANIFSDIAASFRDVFGGRSKSYQLQLDRLTETAITELKAKCRRLGANAILGLSTDFEELAAGKSGMFMLVASGTPVIASESNRPVTTSQAPTAMSGDEVQRRLATAEIRESDEADEVAKLIQEHRAWSETPDALIRIIESGKEYPIIVWRDLIAEIDDVDTLYRLVGIEAPGSSVSFQATKRIVDLDALDIPRIESEIRDSDSLGVANRLHELLLKAGDTKTVWVLEDLEALQRMRKDWPERFPETCEWREKKSMTGKVKREWSPNGTDWWGESVKKAFVDRHGMEPALEEVLDEMDFLIDALSPLGG